MKILQINTVCGIGSTGRIATDMHQILLDNGHESYIAYGRGQGLHCDTAIHIGNSLDKYMHVAKTRLFDAQGFGSKKATKELIQNLESIQPDIVHLHNLHGYYLNIEILFDYLKKAGMPVIWTLHDCWAFTGHCTYFDYIRCDKWEKGCYQCPLKKSYPSSFVWDGAKNNYRRKKELFQGMEHLHIVTPSHWLAGLVKKSFLSNYPVAVIHNGIDLNVFKPTHSDFRKRYGLEEKFILLGVSSTWNKRKGYAYFLELAKQLKQDEIIVLVGLSKEQLKRLPKNIIGLEKTANTENLAEIYSAADAFINPTLEEVMGLVNVEALACGTPVVTFRTGGSVECVDDDTGFVVQKENLEELIACVQVIKQKGKNFYYQNCIRRAKEWFDKNDKFNEYIELYKKYF